MDDVQGRLRAIREREQAATPGPWRTKRAPGFLDVVPADYDPAKRYPHDTPIAAIFYRKSTERKDADGAFIANSRQDVPYLLGVAESALRLLDAWHAEEYDSGAALEERIGALRAALGIADPTERGGER